MRQIVPNLWFDTDAEEAVAFYVSLLADSRIVRTTRYGPDSPGPEGAVMYVEFELLGQPYGAINGGPHHPFTDAVSLEVPCDTQDEIDRVWAALTDGGEPGPCGWLRDRWGLSWQITPAVLGDMLTDPDETKVRRATRWFLALDKEPFDIAALTAAYEGQPQTR